MQHPKASQAGFSLIEMLVAVMIMAIGLLGLVQLQVTAIQANARSSDILAMNALAQNAIEHVVGWSSDDDLLKPAQQVLESANVALPGFENVAVEGAGTFRVQYWTNPAYGAPDVDNLCQVTIRVRGVSGVKGSPQVRMSTLKRWRD